MNKESVQEAWNLWVTETAMKIADVLPGYTVTHEYNPNNLREHITARRDNGDVIYSIDITSLTGLYKKDKEALADRIIFSMKSAVHGIFN